MYTHILLATDGSDLSQKAVEAALALAKSSQGRVLAVKVVPLYPQSYFEGAIVLSTEDITRVEQQWADEGQAIVNAVKQRGEAQGIQVEPITVKSDQVGEAIIKTAERHKCDLIVMASHGRRGFNKLLLGSETQHVLTHSHLPVLVLR
ncbi:MAG: hypothetical protein RLZZ591_389 [Pseudomonadota bacterium]|jgi:nucleotide-binding universal stress UspA family protein